MPLAITNAGPLNDARITQATVLGEDLLVAFSNGTSALLAAKDIKHLTLTAAKEVVTDQEVDSRW